MIKPWDFELEEWPSTLDFEWDLTLEWDLE